MALQYPPLIALQNERSLHTINAEISIHLTWNKEPSTSEAVYGLIDLIKIVLIRVLENYHVYQL